jgi:hypothetical protein
MRVEGLVVIYLAIVNAIVHIVAAFPPGLS